MLCAKLMLKKIWYTKNNMNRGTANGPSWVVLEIVKAGGNGEMLTWCNLS